jgi:diadenosine tetraphosphate (Ap4A) HIT family hydrolase
MSLTIFDCEGGMVGIPTRGSCLLSREDGGHLVVSPPRAVWDRSELTPLELTSWGYLVAATAKAMLDTLPQLAGGCINYWDAGNWALNEQADPKGPKYGPEHRRVHMHLLGRGRDAKHPAWRFGEAPKFPDYADRLAWSSAFERLTAAECTRIVRRTGTLLRERYKMTTISALTTCAHCGYSTVHGCEECMRPDVR